MLVMYRILNSLKAIASLAGAIATGLLAKYTDNEVLTIIAIVSTAILTWVVPNLDPVGLHQDESVQPAEGDPVDEMSYEEAGGLPYPDHMEESRPAPRWADEPNQP